jgi:hydroxyethylthiazole kinase
MRAPQSELSNIAADVLARVRARRPRVHCVTNAVAQAFTANMLLAAGAVPSMTVAPEEIADFVARADALLVNLGTFDAERRKAAEIAVAKAAEHDLPWLLDPVFVDRSPARTDFAKSLVARGPQAIRLNPAEFAALAGNEPSAEAAVLYAKTSGAVVGLTGETDLVTDGERLARIANGDPLMAKVTAMGCAASALVAACMAVEADAWRASVAGLAAIGVAGEIAAANARGPGSLSIAIIDALHALDRAALTGRARVS